MLKQKPHAWAGLMLFIFLTGSPMLGQTEEEPKILGECQASQLGEAPYSEWYSDTYETYEPHAGTVKALAGGGFEDLDVTVFFGTWCGDSRREVPRLAKILDSVGFPAESRTLIAVDNTDEAIKRSPGGEERGLEVYRVPTVIIRRDGHEIARIVEHPVLSLERDLLAILNGDDYIANYGSYPQIREWLDDGLLSDPNVSPSGLANQLRSAVVSEGELAAVAAVLLSRGEGDAAVQLLRVNTRLFRDSASSYRRLANALLESEQPDEARIAARRALRLDPDAEETDRILEILEKLDD
ncbi:MAG: thioredoxin family protein [Acidobacteriota bacterium]|nr:thioredoxin family protein [Acidobacteriota bacterium]MDH3786319.1 thioredoxin family protein [Acidobacteriota bacterium]